MPSIGSLKIRLGLNLNPLIADSKRAQFLLRRSASKYKALGSALTTSLTLPILGAAAASAKLATDLGTNFSKIENLVGISGQSLQDFKSGVSSLSGVVAKSQSELSKALFSVTSAGQRGSEALQILEQSAKASQIGLGDTNEVARAATAVLNAYGKENISAAKSVDVLTAIVREGNVEAETLAPSLGRVIGIAAQMGVSFEEVGASVATFTRLGVGAEEAVTGLRAVLSSFLKPTDQAKSILKELGLTSQDVRDKIKNQGLADTLIDLKNRIGGNDEALATLIPNIRALSTVLGTAGSQSVTYTEILKNLGNSTGIVDKGFKNVSQSAGFQFKKALVDLQNAAIDLGNLILPVILKIVKGVTSVISKFRALDDETKKNIVRFAAFAAAIGPVLTVIGSLKSVAATAIGVFRGLLLAVSAVSAPVALVVAALALGAVYVVNNWDKVRTKITEVANSMINLYNESILFRGVAEFIGAIFKTMYLNVKNIVGVFGTLASAVSSVLSGELSFDSAFVILGKTIKAQAEVYAKDLKEIIGDGIENTINPKKLLNITEADVQAGVQPLIDGFKKAQSEISSFFSLGGGGGSGSVGGGEDLIGSTSGRSRELIAAPSGGESLQGGIISEESLEKVRAFGKGLQVVDAAALRAKEAMTEMALVVSSNLGQALASGGESFRDFANKALSAIKDVIAGLIQVFVASAISSLGPLGLILAPAIGGVASGLFNTIVGGAVPQFAGGGVITKPTLGLMGEYAGAGLPGRSEIVTPEKLLTDIVKRHGGGGGDVNVRGVIKGKDIHLINTRAALINSRSTISG